MLFFEGKRKWLIPGHSGTTGAEWACWLCSVALCSLKPSKLCVLPRKFGENGFFPTSWLPSTSWKWFAAVTGLAAALCTVGATGAAGWNPDEGGCQLFANPKKRFSLAKLEVDDKDLSTKGFPVWFLLTLASVLRTGGSSVVESRNKTNYKLS